MPQILIMWRSALVMLLLLLLLPLPVAAYENIQIEAPHIFFPGIMQVIHVYINDPKVHYGRTY